MKLTKLNLLIAVGLVLLLSTPAQSQYVKTLGGSNYDGGTSVIQTSDGGFLVSGGTRSFGAGDVDVLLARFDAYGNHLWTRTLGWGDDESGSSVIETSNGGFVVFGVSASFVADREHYLAKFDGSGNHLWTKTIRGNWPYWAYAYSVIEASDGGLVVSGSSNSFTGNWELILAKFDSSGGHLWTRTLGDGNREDGGVVIEASDGGLVLAGDTKSFGASDCDLLLNKLDSAGNHLWTKTLGGAAAENVHSIIETSDGGLVVTGYTYSFGAGDCDLLLAKFDSIGNLLWTRTLGGDTLDYGNSVIEASDGGLVAAGITYSFGAGDRDFLLAKFDSTGNLLWTRTLGGDTLDYGHSVIQASDGGLVVTGGTYSFGAGSSDLLLAKFDADGNTCLGEFITPEVDTVSPDTTSPSPEVNPQSPTITSPEPTVTSPTPPVTVVCDDRAPTILSITDVGNDQGRQVRVEWYRCYFDSAGSDVTITEYSLWRRIDEDKGHDQGNEILSSDFGMLGGGRLYPPGEWDFIKTVPARGETTYNTVCPTLGDSTLAEGMYWSVFFVSAVTPDPLVYYDSEPDSGYSLDNIPPFGVSSLDIPQKVEQTLLLTWVVPGEYPGEQSATAYDIRYSNSPIDDDTTAWWNAAIQCEGEPYPASAGQVDSFMVTLDLTQTYYFAMKLLDDRPNYSEISNIVRFTCGDANADTIINSADVVYLINYLFKGGPPPVPMAAGDVNCDGVINSADVVYLINYLFKGGPPPCSP